MSDSQGSFLPTSAIFVLVAALGGALWYSKPLKTFRPQETNPWADPRGATEPIPSRVWMDPLSVIRSHDAEDAAPSKIEALSSVRSDSGVRSDPIVSSYRANEHGKGPEIRFMPVLVPGDGDSDSIERRRRIRYAVVAGLVAEGYSSAARRALGAFRSAEGESGFAVPFEWYRGPRGPVLVAWVNEQLAGISPLTWIEEKLLLSNQPSPDRPPTKVYVLGPSSSDTLLKVMREVDRSEAGRFSGWTILNSRATAPESALLEELSSTSAESLADWFDDRRVAYKRIPCTDDKLIQGLQGELDARGVGLEDPDDVIVIVSELDTLYGRLFTQTLSAGGESKGAGNVTRGKVWEVGYFNGVDGFLREKEKKEDEDKSSRALSRASWKTPVGPGQLDYLRRQAASLRRRERNEEVRIRAVGVVGTDVYDKQLVLQALRPEFPNAIFFTTDLDARLLHNDQYEWTHNLLIASAFGLELHSGLQGQVPAFRDTYQTAEFLAARLAVETVHSELIEAKRHIPRIYEVGRSGAWDLSEDAGLHPKLPAEHRTGGWRFFPLVLLGGLFFGLMLSTLPGQMRNTWRGATPRGRRWLRRGAASLFVIYVSWIVLALRWSDDPGLEPFALGEGISAWPTEFLRVLAAVFSLLALSLGAARLESNSVEIERDFFIPSGAATPLQHAPLAITARLATDLRALRDLAARAALATLTAGVRCGALAFGPGARSSDTGVRLGDRGHRGLKVTVTSIQRSWRRTGHLVRYAIGRALEPWKWAVGLEDHKQTEVHAQDVWARYRRNTTPARTLQRIRRSARALPRPLPDGDVAARLAVRAGAWVAASLRRPVHDLGESHLRRAAPVRP